MSFFHFLPGANALSSFRQQRLLASLADQGIELDSIEAQYLHFIWSTVALSSHDQEILASLLTYGEPFTGTASKKGAVVIPRLGTVSPWASKATDIARQCGLNVLRIERGAQFSWKAKKPLSTAQEQIVLANKSLDKDLIRFYKEGLGDMHSFVASKIFPDLSNLSLDDIKDNHKGKRQIAKSAGFAINYGGTGITIAQNLSIPLEEGEQVYKEYFKAFPGLANYFKQEKARALALGYIQFNNVSGRKCFIPFFEEYQKLHREIYDTEGFWDSYKLEKSMDSLIFKNHFKPKVREYFMKKGDIERMSLNYPIQGSSADITKLAGVYFYRYIIENNLMFIVKLPNVVHDEWIVECPEEMAESISKVLQECMERAGDVFCKTVKLKAEPCVTRFWRH